MSPNQQEQYPHYLIVGLSSFYPHPKSSSTRHPVLLPQRSLFQVQRIEGCKRQNALLRLILSLFFHRQDRKSTRLNSSHVSISYAVFCLKKKNENKHHRCMDVDAQRT